MASKNDPVAPTHVIEAAESAREDAFLFNLDQYMRGRRPLNLVVLALRKAYREAERMLDGYRT